MPGTGTILGNTMGYHNPLVSLLLTARNITCYEMQALPPLAAELLRPVV